ncbi:hypothetical protein FH966_00930 [Lentibacillus cibarius]|uniref:Pyridoxamine kinase/Phosphomethylpyrimidine kinase domain-containing protein n=1 Tax=Lentibacillus cibarius TaxID=2583219 RepID=A0A549YEU8_9BACI|nr:hypothetical protein FFL34_04775 [Lentibacillus cibarius]TRM10395.1 hypothetical protein FH966_00930 [Lentibacillus cibarius]
MNRFENVSGTWCLWDDSINVNRNDGKDKLDTSYNHGGGCTFAAAVTANLANGKPVKEAVERAKDFVTAAIAHGWQLNEHGGPVMHGAYNQLGNN